MSDVEIDTLYRREVFTVGPDDSLAEAARRMHAHDVGSLIVLDGNRFAGIITERDLTRAVAAHADAEATAVSRFMTRDPITIGPHAGVRETAAEMLETEVRHLPVVEDGVLGMISVRDLLDVVVEDVNL